MTARVRIDFATGEGMALRLIGLAERRGFLVTRIVMDETGETATMTLDLEPRDANRSLDVLTLQLRRIHGVRAVATFPAIASAA